VLQEYIANACKPVPAEAHIFLANALVERKRYAEAFPQIDLALSKAKAPTKRTSNPWRTRGSTRARRNRVGYVSNRQEPPSIAGRLGTELRSKPPG
jgi:hypothetical protein